MLHLFTYFCFRSLDRFTSSYQKQRVAQPLAYLRITLFYCCIYLNLYGFYLLFLMNMGLIYVSLFFCCLIYISLVSKRIFYYLIFLVSIIFFNPLPLLNTYGLFACLLSVEIDRFCVFWLKISAELLNIISFGELILSIVRCNNLLVVFVLLSILNIIIYLKYHN